jgi:hypothetical protein
MFEKINIEKLFILPKSLQESDVERLTKDSEERTMTTIKDIIE